MDLSSESEKEWKRQANEVINKLNLEEVDLYARINNAMVDHFARMTIQGTNLKKVNVIKTVDLFYQHIFRKMAIINKEGRNGKRNQM